MSVALLSSALSPRRILVVRGGAIGDFVVTLPVFAALRRHFPGSRIELLGYPHIAGLALAAGLVDEVRALESAGLALAFAPETQLPETLRAFFAGFDLVLSYAYDPAGVFRSHVTRASSAVFVAGPHRPPPESTRHASEILLDPLAALGLTPADAVPRLRFSTGDKAEPHAGPSAGADRDVSILRLAVHPGSGSERKNWPESRWAELLPRLAAREHLRLLLVGGEAEGRRLERLARTCPAGRVEVALSLPLVDLARRLQACGFFLGHDSGITHLAAALGLPGLVLWGESPIAVWRPRHPAMLCLEAGAHLQDLDVASVWAALLPRLAPR